MPSFRAALFSFIGLCVAWTAGCGGSDSGSSGTEGGAGVAGGAGVKTGTGPIACGSTTCNGAQGENCCTGLSGGTLSEQCAAACPENFTALGCDGPEDCAGGACCDTGNAGFGCASSCASGFVQLCHTGADCPSEVGCCRPFSVGGVLVGGCVAPSPGTCS